MKGKEFLPIPTGKFPTKEEEHRNRFEFLNRLKPNPLYSFINQELKHYGITAGRRRRAQNILAFFYGFDFYNQLTQEVLFKNDAKYPIVIDQIKNHDSLVWVNLEMKIAFINLLSNEANDELISAPLQSVGISDHPDCSAPSYIYYLITGLEEASHMHLFNHRDHKQLDSFQPPDHRNPVRLWENSANDPISYRAKLWHEFAALTVQRSYINFYLSEEFPDFTEQFNEYYKEVRKERRRWTRRKLLSARAVKTS